MKKGSLFSKFYPYFTEVETRLVLVPQNEPVHHRVGEEILERMHEDKYVVMDLIRLHEDHRQPQGIQEFSSPFEFDVGGRFQL